MGMHYGVLAADVSADRFVEALTTRVSKLIPGPTRASLNEIDSKPKDDGWPLAVGEYGGKAYLLDSSFILSSDLDMMAGLSDQLKTIVVGCGAETVSGSYWFAAARNGQLLRSYWHCHTDMREPWSRGTPLPSEALQAFDGDLDGKTLFAGMRDVGFDAEAWMASGPFREVFYDGSVFPAKGPLSEEFSRFHALVAIPERDQPKPTVVQRDGGYDLVPVKPGKPKGRGLLGLFKR